MAGGKMAIYSGICEKLKATGNENAQVMARQLSMATRKVECERLAGAQQSVHRNG